MSELEPSSKEELKIAALEQLSVYIEVLNLRFAGPTDFPSDAEVGKLFIKIGNVAQTFRKRDISPWGFWSAIRTIDLKHKLGIQVLIDAWYTKFRAIPVSPQTQIWHRAQRLFPDPEEVFLELDKKQVYHISHKLGLGAEKPNKFSVLVAYEDAFELLNKKTLADEKRDWAKFYSKFGWLASEQLKGLVAGVRPKEMQQLDFENSSLSSLAGYALVYEMLNVQRAWNRLYRDQIKGFISLIYILQNPKYDEGIREIIHTTMEPLEARKESWTQIQARFRQRDHRSRLSKP